MLSKNLIYTNNKVDFLINTDLIDKYHYNSFFKLPKLKAVNIKVSVNDMLKQIENVSDLEKDETILKLKLFIYFFLIFSNKPLIKNNTIVTKTLKKQENVSENVFFNLIITKKSQIYYFLLLFFVENSKNLRYKNNSFFDKICNYSTVTKLKINLPLKNLDYLKEVSFFSPFSLNVKDFMFSICFIVSDTMLLKHKNLIKSLPFFWTVL